MVYRKNVKQQYDRHKPSVKGLAKIKTKRWGEVLYPKGTKPIVAEVKVGTPVLLVYDKPFFSPNI